MKQKQSFIIHKDSLTVLDHLTDEQAGKLFKAIKSYQNGEDIELDIIIKLAFEPFRNQFERDLEKYKKTCERNAANGLKGGRPKKQSGFSETQKTQSVFQKPKKADSDSDSDSDKKKKRLQKNKHNSKARPSSPKEVEEYGKEIGYFVDGQQFIDHYEANGWMRGKNKVKDWKACLRTWKRRSLENNKNESDKVALKVL